MRYVIKWHGLYADGNRGWTWRKKAVVLTDREAAFLHASTFPLCVPAPKVYRIK